MEGNDQLLYIQRAPQLTASQIIIGPIGIVTIASLFFVYSRTSIRAAKDNAKRHRDADGGSISWRNEALRRHGALAKPESKSLLQELFSSGGENEAQKKADRAVVESRPAEINPIEEGIRKAREAGQKKGSE